MHRSDTEVQATYGAEAARRPALAEVRSRLSPLAVAAGLPDAELDRIVLVVELGERILAAARPDSRIAAVIREVLEHAYRTRLGIDLAPQGGIQ